MRLNPTMILNSLRGHGYMAYFVGGYVRDKLLGIRSNDIDIATDCKPEQILSLFQSLDQETKVIEGNKFKVVLVNGTEVATFRKDRYFGKNAKNCEISYGTLDDDGHRRDFTINGMFWDPQEEKLIDFIGGQVDLKNKLVRFIDNPDHRIWEDPNRIIRGCRFRSQIDGEFEPSTLKSLRDHVEMIPTDVDKERIRMEILKAMKTQKASKFFDSLSEIGALKHIFPSLGKCNNVDGGRWHNETIREHNMMVGDSISTKFPVLKLTGYLHDVGKVPASSINPQTGEIWFKEHEDIGAEIVSEELRNLRFTNEEINYVSSLIKFHMRMPKGMGPKATRRLLRDLQEVGVPWKDLVRLRLADKVGNLREGVDNSMISAKTLVKKFWKELRRPKNLPLSVKDLEVNGLDVMEVLGIKPGPTVGKVLNELLELVLDDPNKNEKQILLDEIAKRKAF